MESRLGMDFDSVRLHTDTAAARAAQAIGAKAFTAGTHIVFDSSEYLSPTRAGERLLAHELAHVVQQRSTPPSYEGLRVGASDTRLENEADRAAERAVNGQTTPSLSRLHTGIVQRVKLCARSIGVSGINHAYVDDTGRDDCLGANLPGNYALFPRPGHEIYGCADKTDHSPDPEGETPLVAPCNPRPGVTDLHSCLRSAFRSYNDPSLYSNVLGSNSNTFAGTLARTCCHDPSHWSLSLVPGWGVAPASPCPSVSTALEYLQQVHPPGG